MNNRNCLGVFALSVTGILALQAPAFALPQGGQVTAGQATISTSGAQTTINQSSNRAVLDWNSFNIGSGEHVQINQPGISSIQLDRIHSGNASAIEGSLSSNGQVWLVNPAGIFFGKGAQVDVSGLLATTANISNRNFMSGNYVFDVPGNPNASIINNGHIDIENSGLAAFVGPNVVNNGWIEARTGRLQLAAGDLFTLDLYGDGLINLAAGPAVTSHIVSNSGHLIADGGSILLTEAAAENIVNGLINMSGIIEADTIHEAAGSVVIEGKASNSQINISGTISADAHGSGDGGRVSIRSAGSTDFSGNISARGGDESGNGGFVETSGAQLSVTGKVTTTAANGATGDWLLDPTTMNIITGGGTSLTGSTLDPATLVSDLSTSNITLQADQSITVSSAIDASGNASAHNLTLNAPIDYLNAPIILKNGSTLSGSSTNLFVGAAGLVQNGVDAAAAGGTVNLAAATYNLPSQILIGKNLTLNGDSASGSILNGQNAHRVMEIDGTSGGDTVNLNRLTLENGNASGANESNTAGGLLLYSQGSNHLTVNITNSTISGNASNGSGSGGGGIYNDGSNGGHSTLNITGSTISGNTADGSLGGGIYNQAYNNGTGIVTVTDSTIANNGSGVNGGGIFNNGNAGTLASVTVNNSTISGNGANYYGGGVDNNSGTLTISHSILAGNGSGNGGADFFGGGLTTNGYNIYGLSGSDGGFTGNGGTDIKLAGAIGTLLGSLANNGGPTQTMALVASSPAIAAGGTASSYAIDQRGYARALSGQISIGAYEYNSPGNAFLVNSTADSSGTHIGQLRTALLYSDNNSFFNPYITFDSGVFNTAKTITLTQGELSIGSSLTLDGGPYGVTLDANNASRIMEIDGNTDGITVNLNRLTMTNGTGAGLNGTGNGGALFIQAESGNRAVVAMTNSTIANSTAGNGGGALVDGNTSGNATLTIDNSTITGNSATFGGGLYISGYSGNASLTVTNSTISGNSMSNSPTGGGIFNGAANLTIGNSIIAGNTSNGSEGDYKNSGALSFTSNGYNLYGQNSNAGGFTPATHDILLAGNINTVLGSLANNGGPTQTMALVASSPAIGAGGTASEYALDQRGDFRSLSAQSIGAYEYAPANPYLVNLTTDSGAPTLGNLRTAIDYSNHFGGNPSITFDSSVFNAAKTIILDGTQLTIGSSLTLDGGAYGVTLDANHSSRVMEIDGTSGGDTVNLSNLSFINGNGTGTHNSTDGGALLIYSEGNTANVTVNNSSFINNTGSNNGGAITTDSRSGGHGTLTLNDSAIGNNVAGSQAGAIYNNGDNAVLNINNSTIAGNSSSYWGGAIYNDGSYGGHASLNILNSTIVGNSTTTSDQGGGGGIWNNAFSGGSATMTIGNTILAGNTNGSGESEYINYNGATFTDAGYNLYGQNGSAGGFTPVTHDILLTGGIATVLNTTLASNGGLTKTLALVTGSAAIDAGDPSQINTLDQRGFTRGSSAVGTGSASDIGAYEAAILSASADNQTISFGQAQPSFTYTLTGGPTGHLSGGPALITNHTESGIYPGDIGVGTLTAATGYLLNFTAGQYTIDRATPTTNPLPSTVERTINIPIGGISNSSQSTLSPLPIYLSSSLAQSLGAGSDWYEGIVPDRN